MTNKTPTIRFKSNPCGDESIAEKMASRISMLKAKSTEEFLKKLGATESNASEFRFETELHHDLAREIKYVARNGKRIGVIECYFSMSFSDGLKFVLDCRDLRESDTAAEPETPTKPKPKLPPEQWELALRQCAEISELCDELPDAACDFANSVSEGGVRRWLNGLKRIGMSRMSN